MNSETNVSPLIVVDWGTTNFRAYLVARDTDHYGTCQDSVATPDGLLGIQGDYPGVLTQHIGHWLRANPNTPILLSGMVSSPSGWVEVPHIPCPANIQTLAQNAFQIGDFNHGNTWIIPGLSGLGISGDFDIMRGEEVQYFGARDLIKAQDLPTPEVICFPGTHNKWINLANNPQGALMQFSTFMTGELFNLLADQSLLSNSINPQGPWQEPAFLKGLDNSASQGGIMHQLFTVRSLQLSSAHTHDDGEAYLSGLLIGNEIRSMLSEPAQHMAEHKGQYRTNRPRHVAIVGSNKLAQRYLSALEHMGHCAFTIDAEEATITGALAIAQHLNPQA